MSVVITTYTLASGLMQQGMTWWQALLHDPARQHDRARPDDPQRARRHEIRRVVSRAVPRQLRRHAAPTCRRILRAIVACGWFGIQTWIGGLALDTLLTRRLARLGRRARRRLDRVRRCSGLIQVGDHPPRPRGHQDAAKAGRRRCCSAAALAAAAVGRSTPAAGSAASSASRRGCSRRRRRSGRCFPPRSPPTSATGRRSA